MAEDRVRLTKRMVDALTGGSADQFLWDSDVIGFGLKITPRGAVSYILQYRFEGRSRRFKIGNHGSPWTVETARQEARSLQGKIVDGIDPQQVRASERKELTLGELCDAYLEEGLVTRKESSIVQARINIENHIKPLLGNRRASKVTRADVEQLQRDIAAGKTAGTRKTRPRGLSRVRGGKGSANRTLSTLSAAFGFGVTRGLRSDNPVIGIKRYPGKKMERFLSPAELARLGDALSAAAALGVESVFAIAALRLLVLTGCRKTEILSLKRSYVDPFPSLPSAPRQQDGCEDRPSRCRCDADHRGSTDRGRQPVPVAREEGRYEAYQSPVELGASPQDGWLG